MTIEQILKLKMWRGFNAVASNSMWRLREEVMRTIWEAQPDDPTAVLTRLLLNKGFTAVRKGTKYTHYYENAKTGDILSFNHKDIT